MHTPDQNVMYVSAEDPLQINKQNDKMNSI